METPPPNFQVGGHAGGIHATEDGSLVIKSVLPLELEFYQNLSSSATFEPLRPFLPRFYGTLKLEGQHDNSKPGVLAIKPLKENDTQPRDE